MNLRDFAWEYFACCIGMALIMLAVAALSGCIRSDTETREQTRTTIGPIVAETPVGTVTIQQVPISQERQSTETRTTTAELPPIAAMAPLIPGGAALGGMAGLAGAAFGVWRMLRERSANKALSQTIGGLDEAKASMNAAQIAALHESLAKAQDADVRARIARHRKVAR